MVQPKLIHFPACAEGCISRDICLQSVNDSSIASLCYRTARKCLSSQANIVFSFQLAVLLSCTQLWLAISRLYKATLPIRHPPLSLQRTYLHAASLSYFFMVLSVGIWGTEALRRVGCRKHTGLLSSGLVHSPRARLSEGTS